MKKDKERFAKTVQIKNKKASFEYHFEEVFEAGLVLRGSEIKSIREGKASLQEAYCFVKSDGVYVKSMNISPYKESTYTNHEPLRERKLLLNKREIEKLSKKTEEKGLTIIPIKLYINDRGLAKLSIALAKGKKLHDKRESLKEKETKMELRKMII